MSRECMYRLIRMMQQQSIRCHIPKEHPRHRPRKHRTWVQRSDMHSTLRDCMTVHRLCWWDLAVDSHLFFPLLNFYESKPVGQVKFRLWKKRAYDGVWAQPIIQNTFQFGLAKGRCFKQLYHYDDSHQAPPILQSKCWILPGTGNKTAKP